MPEVPAGFRTATVGETSAPPEHLLRVAAAVTRDAQQTWTEVWDQFKPYIGSEGRVAGGKKAPFVPACGWPALLEKMWLLRHYLDAIERICANKT